MEELSSLETAISPENICPRETCAHCLTHMCVHSSSFRNQELETTQMFTKERINYILFILWKYYTVRKMKTLEPHRII